MLIVVATGGLVNSVAIILYLAGRHELTDPGTPARRLASVLMVQEIMASLAYVTGLVIGGIAMASALDLDAGWNWSVTSDGTWRGILTAYGLIAFAGLFLVGDVLRRLTWRDIGKEGRG
jgi:hypothetical protein